MNASTVAGLSFSRGSADFSARGCALLDAFAPHFRLAWQRHADPRGGIARTRRPAPVRGARTLTARERDPLLDDGGQAEPEFWEKVRRLAVREGRVPGPAARPRARRPAAASSGKPAGGAVAAAAARPDPAAPFARRDADPTPGA